MTITIHHGDCIDIMGDMSESTIDSIVTDPPYGLGFMGKAWDDLPPGPEFAAQALRVLKPGGYVLAFGGTRTWHRLAVAIEDAGFEIRDSIAWMYGNGFPKGGLDEQGRGASLKPAFEPIVVARKPVIGTVAANLAAYGTGALNIDASRITHSSEAGRFPANVILDESQSAALDEQSGVSKSVGGFSKSTGAFGGQGVYGKAAGIVDETRTSTGFGDSGGASRFFYTAKASKRERPVVDGIAHPTVKPLALMRYLAKLVTPPGGLVLDPFAGSGTTLEAAVLEGFRAIGIEREADYIPLIHRRLERVDALLPIEVPA